MEDQLASIGSSRPANLLGRSTTNARNRYVFIETALAHDGSKNTPDSQENRMTGRRQRAYRVGIEKQVRVRYEKRDDVHEAFLKIGCLLICWNRVFEFC